MTLTNDLTVHVVFTGLVLFVRQEGAVTHALLRDARSRDHGDGGHADDHHEPYLAWEGGCKRLDRVRLSLEWLKEDGTPIQVPFGAEPQGPEEVGKFPRFRREDREDRDDQSFEWVPYFDRMGPKNRVAPDCLAQSTVSSKVVAQLLLHGGSIRTGRFAWGEVAREESTDAGSSPSGGEPATPVGKWIPAFLYKIQDGDAGPPDRAAAELVVWDVPAHPEAYRLRIACTDLDSPGTPGPSAGLPSEVLVREGGDLWLTVSNSPARANLPNGTPHPGRVPGALAHHFDMLYDLLDGSVPPAMKRLPKLPGAFRPQKNVIGDVDPRLPFYECDVSPEGYVDRPICIPASADG